MDNYPPHPKPPVAVPGECPWRQSAFVPRCPFVVPGRNFACQSRLVSCRPRHTLHLPLTLPLAAGKFVSAATRSGRFICPRQRSHRSPLCKGRWLEEPEGLPLPNKRDGLAFQRPSPCPFLMIALYHTFKKKSSHFFPT